MSSKETSKIVLFLSTNLLKEQNEQQLRLLFFISSSSSKTKQKSQLMSFMIRRLNINNIAASLTATRPNQQGTNPATTEKTLQLVSFRSYSLCFSSVLQPCLSQPTQNYMLCSSDHPLQTSRRTQCKDLFPILLIWRDDECVRTSYNTLHFPYAVFVTQL